MSQAQVRELGIEEWARLFEIPALKVIGNVPDPRTHRCVVVEADGKIVGCWFLFTALHAEPLWVDPEYRNRRDVAGQLWGEMEKVIEKTDYTGAYVMITEGEEGEKIRRMAQKLQFVKRKGQLWMGLVRSKVGES